MLLCYNEEGISIKTLTKKTLKYLSIKHVTVNYYYSPLLIHKISPGASQKSAGRILLFFPPSKLSFYLIIHHLPCHSRAS